MKLEIAIFTALLFVSTRTGVAVAQYPGEPEMPRGWREDPVADMRGHFERGSPNGTVRRAQDRLRELGHYSGPTSHGVLGPDEKRAVWNFQKANGLRVSGSLDPATVEALGLTGGGGGDASPKSAPPSR